ncbi:MAG: hypothetical protein IJO20_07210 [Ruminococcus sp.]|nr:hypothetical protein [Ruminococcus sp.]
MAKKATLIVLAVLLVAGTIAGVYFYNNSVNGNKTTNSSTPNEIYLDEDESGEEYIIDSEETSGSTESSTEDFIPIDDNLSDNTLDITTTNFTIDHIIDHTTGEEVSGRVVFGKSFNAEENYIKFDSNGNFEIYLSGYLDNTKKGTYSEYDKIVYVEFEDGTAAEYDVKYTDNGIISHIIVNYGDYDVYFS